MNQYHQIVPISTLKVNLATMLLSPHFNGSIPFIINRQRYSSHNYSKMPAFICQLSTNKLWFLVVLHLFLG
jgi:hypothetical protein